MNHLTAIAKIRELISDVADNYTIRRLERRIRRSNEPSQVVDNLKKAVKVANEFWEWSETIPNIDQKRRNQEHTHLLVWGHMSGSLEDAKKEFSHLC